MSAGDLAWLRAAIVAQLLQRPQPLIWPLDDPQRPWLEWLEVPLLAGPCPAQLNYQPLPESDCQQLRQQGWLPEMVYSLLVQSWWHPQQDRYLPRTRSEIQACFLGSQLDCPGWPLDWDSLRALNAYRLQELTPSELLQASRPFWQGSCSRLAAMEAWVLLHLEGFQRLQDVAACLQPFFDPQAPVRLPPGLEQEVADQILAR